MAFSVLPTQAAWRHHDARDGFEVAYFERQGDGWRLHGCTTAVEDGQSWAVDYQLDVDANWITRTARITSHSATGRRQVVLEADGSGNWTVNGVTAPHLTGCLDVDLESSAMTNTLPVHRLALAAGQQESVPAAYVRALDLRVERLEQTYLRVADDASGQNYDYAAPVFDVRCRLQYDDTGLVVDYPGLASRVRS